MAGKFFKRKLSNGITVVMEKRDLPVISFAIANRFGGAYEDSKIKGAAHVMEHLLYTGTKTRTSEDISREIEKHGGVLNGFTSNETTAFWCKLPSEHLFKGLDILADMIKNPKFDRKKFEKEKKVILEEIKMCHDSPQRDIMDKIETNLYEKPFGENIIGSAKTVSALKRDFIAELFKRVYSPENFIVVAVGNGDFEKICSYIEENFKAEHKKTEIKPIHKRNCESVEERGDIDQAHFTFAFHAPLLIDDDFYALEVLDAYLANGMSSRLFIEIREKRGLAYAVKSFVNAEKDYSYYVIYAGTTKDAVPKVKQIILSELKKAGKMSERDLQQAKERVIGLRRVSSEESSDVMGELLTLEMAGDAGEYYRHEEKINSVTLEQVKRLARVKKYSTAAIVPKK
jgi:predicted Zn-dependent peptidase